MTLPDGVLLKRPGKTKANPAFVQNGQALTWSGIDLNKRGASLRLRLKVNVTNCADGLLAFDAGAIVGGSCPAVAANPVSATVKHKKGWEACPPSALCSLDSGLPGLYACPPTTGVCADGSIAPLGVDLAGCLAHCQTLGSDYMVFFENMLGAGVHGCGCAITYDGYYMDPAMPPTVTFYALGAPRTPDPGPLDSCPSGRRLHEQTQQQQPPPPQDA
jgi:hypothetical protein